MRVTDRKFRRTYIFHKIQYEWNKINMNEVKIYIEPLLSDI